MYAYGMLLDNQAWVLSRGIISGVSLNNREIHHHNDNIPSADMAGMSPGENSSSMLKPLAANSE